MSSRPLSSLGQRCRGLLLPLLAFAGLTTAALAAPATPSAPPPPPSDPQVVGGVDISRWRGFNLLEKFTLARNAPFLESDFQWIRELGFNFVRLPIDYRCYTAKGDWLQWNEQVLREIDQAIAYGDKYDIHVCLNLHRAPGFCINPPAEPTNLWTDEKTLEVFVAHWTMFAARYRHVPAHRLSFNLLNEPSQCSRTDYLKVFRRAIQGIQQVDTKRLIVVDGHQVGKDPSPEFLPFANVVQSTRGYHPGQISHYRASWMRGSEQWPTPAWPLLKVPGYLYGPDKKDYHAPLRLEGDFPAGTVFELAVAQLSVRSRLVAQADGRTLADTRYDARAEPAAWKRPADSQHPTYNPTSPTVYRVVLPAAARAVAIANTEGDWIKLRELTLVLPDGRRLTYPAEAAWGRPPGTLAFAADGRLQPPAGQAPDYQLQEYLQPWLELNRRGAPVFVGEWGCFNKTPHPVALAWMQSWLENWRRARFGWALWEFRGSFGILDSKRADVTYEDFHGHQLDRAMLELLQRYRE